MIPSSFTGYAMLLCALLRAKVTGKIPFPPFNPTKENTYNGICTWFLIEKNSMGENKLPKAAILMNK